MKKWILKSALLLLPFLSCSNKYLESNSIINPELPEITAINNIGKTAKYAIHLIDKYEKLIKNNKKNISDVDNKLCELLLKYRKEYEIFSIEKCSKDLHAKYWITESTFGPVLKDSARSRSEISNSKDSIKVLDISKMTNQISNCAQYQRIQRFRSDEEAKIKLLIALKEYQHQLNKINKNKYACDFRSNLLESYAVLLKCYFNVDIIYKMKTSN